MACRSLELVDQNVLSLEQLIAVPEDKRVITSVISDRFIHPGIALSVHNLLQVMIDESDNTATDVLLDVIGGPAKLTATLRDWGVDGQRIDRDTRGLISSFLNLGDGPFFDLLEEARLKPGFEEYISSPNQDFESDIRDTSTPFAMCRLLDLAFNKTILSERSAETFRDVMASCRTGEARLKGRLPLGARMADKTGTIGSVTNDVGLMSLSDDKGEIVVSAFVKGGGETRASRERLLADAGRMIHDAFIMLL